MKFGQIVWVVDTDRFGMYINPNVYQGRIIESEIVYDGESKTFYTVECEIFEYNGSHYSEIFKVEENLCFEYKADAVNYTLSLQKENKRLNDLITRDFSIANLTDRVIAYIEDNSQAGFDYKKVSLLVAREIEKRFS